MTIKDDLARKLGDDLGDKMIEMSHLCKTAGLSLEETIGIIGKAGAEHFARIAVLMHVVTERPFPEIVEEIIRSLREASNSPVVRTAAEDFQHFKQMMR